MKITILDGHALNPGDLSWDVLSEFGDYKVYDRTAPDEVVNRIGDSEMVLLNKVQITDEILSKCPNLKYIGVQATGYNVIDLESCTKRGITVTNVPAYSTKSVAQIVFAYITEFATKSNIHSEDVKKGGWINSKDFCYWKQSPVELEGKTLGIFGYGSIGQRVAYLGKAFGMKVIVCTRRKLDESYDVEQVSKEELFSRSDFLSLHAPLTAETQNIVDESTLKLMKKSAFLINTARGGFIDENVLADYLNNDKIAGFACDVLRSEPMDKNCPLLKAKNCIITPHIAWAPLETRQRLLNVVVSNIRNYLDGNPTNVVNS